MIDSLIDALLAGEEDASSALADALLEADRNEEAAIVQSGVPFTIRHDNTIASAITSDEVHDLLRQIAKEKVTILQLRLQQAKEELLVHYQKLCLIGYQPDSPAFKVCCLVAQNIVIAGDDKYPTVSVPEEIRLLVCQTVRAEVLQTENYQILIGQMKWNGDCSGSMADEAWRRVYACYRELESYCSNNRALLQ